MDGGAGGALALRLAAAPVLCLAAAWIAWSGKAAAQGSVRSGSVRSGRLAYARRARPVVWLGVLLAMLSYAALALRLAGPVAPNVHWLYFMGFVCALQLPVTARCGFVGGLGASLLVSVFFLAALFRADWEGAGPGEASPRLRRGARERAMGFTGFVLCANFVTAVVLYQDEELRRLLFALKSSLLERHHASELLARALRRSRRRRLGKERPRASVGKLPLGGGRGGMMSGSLGDVLSARRRRLEGGRA
jgi:hypothetical protein